MERYIEMEPEYREKETEPELEWGLQKQEYRKRPEPLEREREYSGPQLADRVYLFVEGQEKGIVMYLQTTEEGKLVVSGADVVDWEDRANNKNEEWQMVKVVGGDPFSSITKIVSPKTMVSAIAQLLAPVSPKTSRAEYAVVDLDLPERDTVERLMAVTSKTLERTRSGPELQQFLHQNFALETARMYYRYAGKLQAHYNERTTSKDNNIDTTKDELFEKYTSQYNVFDPGENGFGGNKK